MKKFLVPCNFNGVKAPVTLYIGSPEAKHHPIAFQADWLSKERGGSIPQEVMVSLEKLMSIASKNNVLLEDLCEYALQAASIPANAVLDSGVKKEEEKQQSVGVAIGGGTAAAKTEGPVEMKEEKPENREQVVQAAESVVEKPETVDVSSRPKGIAIATAKIAVPVNRAPKPVDAAEEEPSEKHDSLSD